MSTMRTILSLILLHFCRLNVATLEWKLILSQQVDGTNGYFPVIIRDGTYNQPNPSINPYTIINSLNPSDFQIHGEYEFRLIYDDGAPLSNGQSFDKTWRQQSWLTDNIIVGSSLGSTIKCGSFIGIAESDGHGTDVTQTFLDGNGNGNGGSTSCWYQAVGLTEDYKQQKHFNYYQGKFPVLPKSGNPNAVLASSVKLYVRDPSWKLILSQQVDGTNGYFPVSIRDGSYNQPDPSINPYSIVNSLNPSDFEKDGEYEFGLVYNDGAPLSNGQSFARTWTQQSWLTDSIIVGSSLGSTIKCGTFIGLAESDGQRSHVTQTFLDGNGYGNGGSTSCWYQAVGLTEDYKQQNTFTYYQGQFPVLPKSGNPNAVLASNVKLYARKRFLCWDLILSQEVDGTNGYFPDSIVDGSYNQPNPSINPYSIVNSLNPSDFEFNNKYEFRLVYNDAVPLSNGQSFDRIWTQKSWLTDSIVLGSNLGSTIKCGTFIGLAESDGNKQAFLDGNGAGNGQTFSCWYQAVGLTERGSNYYEGRFPVLPKSGNPNAILASSVKLYVCRGGNCDENSPKMSKLMPRFQASSNNEKFLISSSTLLIIGGLVILLLFSNIIIMSYLNCDCCQRKRGRYVAVKVLDSSEDEMERKQLNV